MPFAPPSADLPADYGGLLAELKQRIGTERLRVVTAANGALVLLYWDIGRQILIRQGTEGWGARVIDRLALDLCTAFPDMRGLSARNLKYMRAFSAAWPSLPIVQEVLAQLPWYSHLVLLERVSDPDTRLWYDRKAIEHGWSRNALGLQIDQELHRRQGKALTNFELTLPPAQSDLATQIFKDPYLFGFLGAADPRREREVEQALIEHVQAFLLELGAGFAFVGRQIAVEVGGENFYIDLLFYHLRLRCFVVIELKSVPFEPEFLGKLNFYLSAVDEVMRHEADRPTIGLLLVKHKDRVRVEYALRGLQKPIGVAEWETQIVERLPRDLESSLPTIEQIERELARR